MDSALRNTLWNRAVLLVFALPAVGYLGFLSQFLVGEPTGVLRAILLALFVFALPIMALYGTLLGGITPVDQGLGTVGFFLFAYLVAVVLVWAARRGRTLVRGRRPARNDNGTVE
ncbi:hypothetical protein ACFQH6_13375 [Halobacteriaceae archaeon GCM10025711]